MNSERFNDLAALMDEDLSEEDRQGLVDKLVSEGESPVLLGMLHHPALSRENNAPIPFEINASYLGGWRREYVRSVAVKNLKYARRSADLIAHFSRILGANPVQCFRKQVELDYAVPNELGTILINPEVDGESFNLHLSHYGPGGENGSIEVWEKGNILRKSTCSAVSKYPITGRKSGTAVVIRHSASSVGVEILLSEIEFSVDDWKRACLAACLEGQFLEALKIFRDKSVDFSMAEARLEKTSAFLNALKVLTRSESLSLMPLPATRSAVETREKRLEVYQPVWQGIAATWPEADDLSNPWSEADLGAQPASQGTTTLAPDVQELIDACLHTVQDPTSIARKADQQITDTNIANGWAALEGWTHLLHEEYQEALKCFVSIPPIEGDPFGLAPSASLAKHLLLSHGEDVSQRDIEKSSDEVWKDTFASIL